MRTYDLYLSRSVTEEAGPSGSIRAVFGGLPKRAPTVATAQD